MIERRHECAAQRDSARKNGGRIKKEKIECRLTGEEKAFIQRAATLINMTVSEFAMNNLLRVSHAILEGTQTLVSDEEFNEPKQNVNEVKKRLARRASQRS